MKRAKWWMYSSKPKAVWRLSDPNSLKALIVAAGLGSRLRAIAPSKPLAAVNGKPLIQNVIESATQAGIDEFVVVTGYQAIPIRAFIDRFVQRTGLRITVVHNPEWTRSNGLSVLAAESLLDNEFVLLMADHLFEPGLLGDLLAAPRAPGSVVLAVDRRLNNPLVDLDDVTRVRTDISGGISAIGKGLRDYDAFDTGVFLTSRALIEGIRTDLVNGGHGSISGGMSAVSQRSLAFAFDIGDRFWLDVDDVAAFEHAERLTA